MYLSAIPLTNKHDKSKRFWSFPFTIMVKNSISGLDHLCFISGEKKPICYYMDFRDSRETYLFYSRLSYFKSFFTSEISIDYGISILLYLTTYIYRYIDKHKYRDPSIVEFLFVKLLHLTLICTNCINNFFSS